MHYLGKSLIIPALLLLSAPAPAEDPVEATREDVVELVGLDESGVLSDEELNSQRAREDIPVMQVTVNDQTQDGDVTDNVAIGNTNGNNLISGEAFSNSAGFMSTIQNTGNNVLIQNSTIINVSVDAASPE